VTTTVLVVDDEKKLRNTLRDHLERDGYTVLEAADGQAALGDISSAARSAKAASHLTNSLRTRGPEPDGAA
jgi:CheY-like chemotaxis protein